MSLPEHMRARHGWLATVLLFFVFAQAGELVNAAAVDCHPQVISSQAIADELCARLTAQLSAAQLPKEATSLTRRRHAKGVAQDLKEVLVSEGFYTATVEVQRGAGADPSLSSYVIALGPRFQVTGYEAVFSSNGASSGDSPPQPDEIDLKITASPVGKDIADLQGTYIAYLHDHGFPFARIQERVVEIREETATAKVVWHVDQGAKCIFGPLEVSGLVTIEEGYVRRLIDLPVGEDCSQSVLLSKKSDLAKTGLFSLVRLDFGEENAEPPMMPVVLSLTERRHRTIGLGVSYETNVGVGGKMTWEHRNILGRGERLRSQVKIHEITQSATLDFRKLYPKRQTTLFGDVSVLHETKDAYDASQIGFGFGYERPFLQNWRLTYSMDIDYTEVESEGQLEKGLEFALPIKLQRSNVDEALDPRSGYRLTLQAQPVTSAVGSGATFLRLDARTAQYFPLPVSDSSSLAFWTHMGSTHGVALDDLPATRRFFGGGAQSVRAIEYEHLGSFGPNEAPIGGRSIFETGLELRSRITQDWGAVVFIEGGRNFTSPIPDFSQELLWGGGVGLRYQTAIGPLRIDVATPFNPRTFDDPIQVYIGLGHAF